VHTCAGSKPPTSPRLDREVFFFVNWAVVLPVFVVIFLAELPDKSMFASLVLGTRYRPLFVWIGIATAFAVHVVLAVLAGGLIALLPQRLVDGIVAVMFAVGAVWVLRHHDNGPEEVPDEPEAPTFWRVAALSFGVVFVGEWGDITQLATANLAASYADPLSVTVGAVLALWAVSGLAVGVGAKLLTRVPLRPVQLITAVIMLGLALWSAVAAVRG
jgi:putative Ca2+/H+ antiporter (TMEM165/GDT1 family)